MVITAQDTKLKPGFKETELGVIPEEWNVTILLNITVDGITNGVFNDPTKVGRGYRLINVLNLYHGYNIDTKNLSRLELPLANFTKKKVKKGDLFFTRSSLTPDGIAFCNFCNEEADDITFDGHIMKITPNANSVNSAFLRLYCISKVARKYFISSAKQTTMTTIGQSELAQLPIPLPSLREQAAIANVFSDTDALIECLEKLIAKKRDIKQATMQQLLHGKKRLPGFEKKKIYKQTELGVIPEDWNCLKMTDVTISSAYSIKIGPFGSALKKEFLTEYGFKVYGQENVYQKDMSIGDRFISSARFKELKSCEIIPGDFLISMMGTIGKCIIVPKEIDAGIMDSHLLRIRFDTSKIDPYFVAKLFETKIILDQIKQLSVGGIMEGLSSTIIRDINIPLPPTKNEQTAIATIFSDMDAEIDALEQKRDKTRALKQGMMQELLTGKTRLI